MRHRNASELLDLGTLERMSSEQVVCVLERQGMDLLQCRV